MVQVGQARYYTPSAVARLVVSLIPMACPRTAIDICCGSWNLLAAARDKWPSVRLTGVDVDPGSASLRLADSKFHLLDGRKFALKQHGLGIQYDIVLANPPFGKIAETFLRKGLERANGMERPCLRGYAIGRMETEMILANAALVRPGGYLGAIVPSTVVEGTSFRMLRIMLASAFMVHDLVELPRDTFPGGQVYSYAILLQKSLPDRVPSDTALSIARQSRGTDCVQVAAVTVPSSSVMSGTWVARSQSKFSQPFEALVYRGQVSSQQFVADSGGVPVLHATGTPSSMQWQPTTRFIDSNVRLRKMITVKSGDILVNRIGKAAGYWALYQGPEVLVSDCLLILRCPEPAALARRLGEASVNGCLRHLVRGVATRFVSARELSQWLGLRCDGLGESLDPN